MEVEPTGTSRTLISQGAEARVYLSTYLGRPTIVKERFAKTYRHPELDSRLNKERVTGEARMLARVRTLGVDTPCVYLIEAQNLRIYMEYIQGMSTKQFIFQNLSDEGLLKKLAFSLGKCIALLHSAGVIHGDMTTSNFMLREGADPGDGVIPIDFGLSYVSNMEEDKAVDLYVLERAFASTHPNSDYIFEAIMISYRDHAVNGPRVLKRLEKVRARGRKKMAFG
eukprot:TRINITY_DN16321_c0_g1_i1.p1 TRINITY_DN16321_c0_g1~~TRINITY_DN16321_c0_g1_i1.p1  ORF type:complete len:225 (+),score=45.77 TRINITY_DN16321_c0_g1_i1:245-919(+)